MVEIREIREWLKVNNYRFSQAPNLEERFIIEKPAAIDNAKKSNISFSKKYTSTQVGIVFCKPDIEVKNALISVYTDNPRLDFIKCISVFFKPNPCKIIKGNNVIIGANCSIGADGFGYEKDINGMWLKFPHFGNVILEDDVEIGSNVCIDRGSLKDTIIKKGVKIDNFVHIAHNVVVGENTLIIAHAMIAGSVEIGKNCWIGPSSSIINGVKIGNNVVVGIGSNLIRDIPDNKVVAGNPAKEIRDNALYLT